MAIAGSFSSARRTDVTVEGSERPGEAGDRRTALDPMLHLRSIVGADTPRSVVVEGIHQPDVESGGPVVTRGEDPSVGSRGRTARHERIRDGAGQRSSCVLDVDTAPDRQARLETVSADETDIDGPQRGLDGVVTAEPFVAGARLEPERHVDADPHRCTPVGQLLGEVDIRSRRRVRRILSIAPGVGNERTERSRSSDRRALVSLLAPRDDQVDADRHLSIAVRVVFPELNEPCGIEEDRSEILGRRGVARIDASQAADALLVDEEGGGPRRFPGSQ